MTRILFVLLFLIASSAHAQQKISREDLKDLKNRLEGSFDSREQSEVDNTYYPILLNIREISLKGKQAEGYWLYVEQAMANDQAVPYRQRIYHLFKLDNTTLVAKVYELKDPLQYAGAWSQPELIKNLRMDSLLERPGCAFYINKDENGNFYGTTAGTDCESSLDGATYASGEMTIYPNMIVSWDRGYDATANQVWGPSRAGYRFRKFIQLRKPKD